MMYLRLWMKIILNTLEFELKKTFNFIDITGMNWSSFYY